MSGPSITDEAMDALALAIPFMLEDREAFFRSFRAPGTGRIAYKEDQATLDAMDEAIAAARSVLSRYNRRGIRLLPETRLGGNHAED